MPEYPKCPGENGRADLAGVARYGMSKALGFATVLGRCDHFSTLNFTGADREVVAG